MTPTPTTSQEGASTAGRQQTGYLALVSTDPDDVERCTITALSTEGPVSSAWLSARADSFVTLDEYR